VNRNLITLRCTVATFLCSMALGVILYPWLAWPQEVPDHQRTKGSPEVRDYRIIEPPPILLEAHAVPVAPSDFDLAYYHAPIHYQDTNSKKYRADYITRFDYDGDRLATNNWDNLKKFPLKSYVYFSIVETCSHWYIVYSFYHPQDWAGPGGQEHEGDTEGFLAIVRKDGSGFGKLEAIVTTFHFDFYAYTPAGSPLRNGPIFTIKVPADQTPIRKQEDIDGQLTMQMYDGSLRPMTNQEDKGHGLKAWPHAGNFLTGNGKDGIIYYPSRAVAQVPKSGNDRHVKYGLLDIFAPNGLWTHQLMDIRTKNDGRSTGPTFLSWGIYRGDKSGGCGSGITITCKENADYPPWKWDDTGFSIITSSDNGVYAGEPALDPAHLAKMYFTAPAPFSEKYLRNRYLSDLKSNGYHQSNLPKGWPQGLNLNHLFAKLTTNCP
jgi:hypothetical protein